MEVIVGFNNQEYVGNEHSRNSFFKDQENLATNGRQHLDLIKEKAPFAVAVNWIKANPYKASTFGLLSILSIRSRFFRKVGRLGLSLGAASIVKKKFDEASTNYNS